VDVLRHEGGGVEDPPATSTMYASRKIRRRVGQRDVFSGHILRNARLPEKYMSGDGPLKVSP